MQNMGEEQGGINFVAASGHRFSKMLNLACRIKNFGNKKVYFNFLGQKKEF